LKFRIEKRYLLLLAAPIIDDWRPTVGRVRVRGRALPGPGRQAFQQSLAAVEGCFFEFLAPQPLALTIQNPFAGLAALVTAILRLAAAGFAARFVAAGSVAKRRGIFSPA